MTEWWTDSVLLRWVIRGRDSARAGLRRVAATSEVVQGVRALKRLARAQPLRLAGCLGMGLVAGHVLWTWPPAPGAGGRLLAEAGIFLLCWGAWSSRATWEDTVAASLLATLLRRRRSGQTGGNPSGVNLEPMKIVRLIGRLNIGGPARHAVLLTRALNGNGFSSCLVTGVPERQEGDMGYLVAEQQLTRRVLPTLRRSIHPLGDLRAFWQVWRVLRQERPRILHTHTAKAGALGRCAGWLYNRASWPGARRGARRVILVHTFHGHVLSGYFGGFSTALFTWAERALARITDRIVVVSESVKQDLLSRRIGTPAQIRVVPLGFDLRSLLDADAHRGRVRARYQLEDDYLVVFVGRLVPVKQPHLLIEAARELSRQAPDLRIRYVFVGDGELREALQRLASSVGSGQTVLFLGWQRNVADVYADADVVCLTSRNEGTPVAIVEALAAGKPVVATDVGGVRDLVCVATDRCRKSAIPAGGFEVHDHGVLIGPGDSQGAASALRYLLERPLLRHDMGQAGRRFVRERFAEERLTEDIKRLYRELIEA